MHIKLHMIRNSFYMKARMKVERASDSSHGARQTVNCRTQVRPVTLKDRFENLGLGRRQRRISGGRTSSKSAAITEPGGR